MNKIINILLLTIIFVFDPLAIALVIAANFAFEQLRIKTKKKVYGEQVPEKSESQIVEVPVEVEKMVYKDNPINNDPIIAEALKHARRAKK